MAQQERALDAKLVEHGRRGEQYNIIILYYIVYNYKLFIIINNIISSPLTSKHTHIHTCSYTYMHGHTKQINEIFKTSNRQVEEPSIVLLPGVEPGELLLNGDLATKIQESSDGQGFITALINHTWRSFRIPTKCYLNH